MAVEVSSVAVATHAASNSGAGEVVLSATDPAEVVDMAGWRSMGWKWGDRRLIFFWSCLAIGVSNRVRVNMLC